ncbi:MAG: phosphomannomutase/phosphoglucomutase [Acidobacteria bacterium]|nr:phosphomannomutase/phosphoglucomutase [Acidobacteriota bacterium]MBI3282437.1 phosphomannomutase/phosphoglucomutase [Acidobacteriota bacterium]
MLKPTIFREYDIRGIADVDLPDADIEQLGRAIGTYLQRRAGRRLNVACDVRLSSERLSEAIIRGLTASGCDVTDLGAVPTPLLYYSVFHLRADGGVMITGSHNPPEYNGFKVVSGAATIHGEQIQELRRMLEAGDLASGQGQRRTYDIVTPYVEEIASQFKFSRRVKVAIDAGNGTAGPAMHRILERLNVDASELFFEMDGFFPNHHPDPTVERNLKHLVDAVQTQKAELGIAFDGDADRIGAVDEKGVVVWGDYLMLIYAREILSRKPGATFIGEVKCSQVMYDEIEKLGGNAIMYRTGHSLIKAKMKEEHAELAGEMSGHMFFADRYYGFDDALYAACRLIEIVADSGQPLSAQTAGLPKMVSTPEIRIDCPDEIKFDVVRRVAEEFRKRRKIVDVDGARVLFPEGWGLVRASNTQPVLVMRFEAKTPALLEAYRKEVEQVVERARNTVSVV